MIAEAIDTAITLGWAFLAWLALLSIVTGIALYAAVVISWCALRTLWLIGRALWRGVGRPTWARNRLRARLFARRTRPDYEEAA
ncbi:hypothetical protein [Streptomyces luteogriseus]|uniref:hypothetical protein n=1 Tax=Streptomyces luteogriseus TaxID=68233 RepID=UPI0037ABBE06